MPISEKEEIEETISGDGREVLLVDDEPLLVAQLFEFFEKKGYRPSGVSDSTEALTLFQQNPERFSIIVTDQTMPKMSGIELISRIRKLRPELPAIICSGYSDKIDAESAEEMGVVYLDKPVNLSNLLHKMRKVIDNRKLALKMSD